MNTPGVFGINLALVLEAGKCIPELGGELRVSQFNESRKEHTRRPPYVSVQHVSATLLGCASHEHESTGFSGRVS